MVIEIKPKINNLMNVFGKVSFCLKQKKKQNVPKTLFSGVSMWNQIRTLEECSVYVFVTIHSCYMLSEFYILAEFL